MNHQSLVRHLRGIQSTCACQGVGFDQRLMILSRRAFFREAFKVMMRILWESSTGMLWGGVSVHNFTLTNLCFVYPPLWFEVIMCSVIRTFSENSRLSDKERPIYTTQQTRRFKCVHAMKH